MCSGPSFSMINVGDEVRILEKDYKCLACGNAFKGLGVIPVCPQCNSKNVERAKQET